MRLRRVPGRLVQPSTAPNQGDPRAPAGSVARKVGTVVLLRSPDVGSTGAHFASCPTNRAKGASTDVETPQFRRYKVSW